MAYFLTSPALSVAVQLQPLFGKTDYMSEICANILEILEALDHFKVSDAPRFFTRPVS